MSLRISNPLRQSPMTSSDPLPFCTAELERALSEQLFGISSYSITLSSPLRAVASVTLLEGRTVAIQLTTRGYTVRSSKSRNVQSY